jgi:hypothetical protein
LFQALHKSKSGIRLVPHSQCSLWENPKFLQNFKFKNNKLREISKYYFCLISAIVIQAWHLKVKTIALFHQMVCISQQKITKLT